MRRVENILRFTLKELYSLKRDIVLIVLVFWAFSAGVYLAAEGLTTELKNSSIAIVDEDRSQLSARIREAFRPPEFKPPQMISFAEIDASLDRGRQTFVLVIPGGFEADIRSGERPSVQLNIDATAVVQAGIGASYISNIFSQELSRFAADIDGDASQSVGLVLRYAFNPNLTNSWFSSVMEIINFLTMLAVVLTGAAIIREREHGTLEHLLVMPVSPTEIMMGKVLANGLVLLVATAFSLWVVVEGALAVPISGSIPLFLLGSMLYLFFASALGIFLGTLARSMPQFGLLFILTILPMTLLSGGLTPLESQPPWLQNFTYWMPSAQFVAFAQGILYRGAGFEIVWPQFLAVAVFGLSFFVLAAARFRNSIAVTKQ